MSGSKPFSVPSKSDLKKIGVGAAIAAGGVVASWLLGDITGVNSWQDLAKLAAAAGLSVIINAVRKWVSDTTTSK